MRPRAPGAVKVKVSPGAALVSARARARFESGPSSSGSEEFGLGLRARPEGGRPGSGASLSLRNGLRGIRLSFKLQRHLSFLGWQDLILLWPAFMARATGSRRPPSDIGWLGRFRFGPRSINHPQRFDSLQ
jgi:hypothetical protein